MWPNFDRRHRAFARWNCAIRVNALRLRALLALSVIASPVLAGTVYKCIGSRGELIYQDAPCPKTQKQQTLHLSDSTAAPSPQMPVESVSTDDVPTASPPVTQAIAPATSLTQLYRCTHAVDGSAYISPNGNPQPFLAPYGMLGAADMPLAQAYGSGGAGISAPEVSRGRVTAGLIANNYVWVQDRCRPMSVPEICRALRDQYQDNAQKLRRAFKSDQAPLQQRDTELRAQLTNCQ